MRDDRLREIACLAVEAFWSAVKKNFPHACDGSLDAPAAARFAALAESAVVDWGRENDRDEWTEPGSIVQINFSDGPSTPAKFKNPIPALVWESNYDTFRSRARIRPLDWRLRNYRKESDNSDPGLVLLEFDRRSGSNERGWFWRDGIISHLVSVHPLIGATYSIAKNAKELAILQVVDGAKLDLARLPLSSDFEATIQVAATVRRLVGELNMLHYALTARRAKCPQCGGVGKIGAVGCSCSSGKSCMLHSKIWKICSLCNGAGEVDGFHAQAEPSSAESYSL